MNSAGIDSTSCGSIDAHRRILPHRPAGVDALVAYGAYAVTNRDSIVCIRKTARWLEMEREYANRFGLPLKQDPSSPRFKYCLQFSDNGLALHDLDQPRARPIRMSAAALKPMSRKNLFGFALGKSKSVVDATAGLGADTLLMARMGYSVTAVERSPAIAALLADGVSRICETAPHLAIDAVFADCLSAIEQFEHPPQTIYLDPMFPQGRKPGVRVRRKVEVLRDLAGSDDNAHELVFAATRMCTGRVVLKRPLFAATLNPEHLADCFRGKLVRYDVYRAQLRR